MATKKISALNSIGTIDPANDVIPIVDVSLSTTDKVTPNALFGITGSVVGTTDTQALANKTLGNTNTITVKDNLLTLQDDGDATKQVQFQLSGITTGNTRTLTIPDASTTLVGTATTQTLTNKTLTSPIVTGGSIDNATITVDSVSGHTTSTIVTVGGVQMNNGTIGTSGAVVTASIAAGAVVPNSLSAGTGTGWAMTSYTPTTTNMTVGNGTLIGAFTQIGKMTFVRISFTLGTTSAIGSNPTLSTPVTANSAYLTDHPVGSARLVNSGVAGYPASTYLATTTTLRMAPLGVVGSLVDDGGISSTSPFTWIAGSIFTISATFEAA